MNFRIFVLFVLHQFVNSTFVKFHRHEGFVKCRMLNSRLGHCIPLKQCAPLYALLMKIPLTFADQAYLKRSQCGYAMKSPLVCCPESTSKSNDRFDGRRFHVEDLPQPGQCGTVGVNEAMTMGFIVGGNEAKIYESPWMALLQYTKPNNTKGFHCGGVLIHKNYVLTASHCVNGNDLQNLKWQLTSVRLGEWDTDQPIDCENEICSESAVDVAIKEIIPHEMYRSTSTKQEYDIALIRLAESVRNSLWIKPICLPISERLKTKLYDDVPMQVAGWGYTSDGKNSNVKRQVTLKGVSLEQCNDKYKRFHLTLTEKQLCAGGVQGQDSCKGDSGSPLMKYDDRAIPPHWYVVGIVSFGLSQCGQAGWPGVYTRVSSYIDWILNNMRHNG